MLWIWTSIKNLWIIIVVIVRISLLFTPILSILIFSIWRVPGILYFCWTVLFIFVKPCYFEFWVEVYALLLECKELISRWILYFCWTILFWIWVEDLKCMHCFWDVKKIISKWMLYLILCRLKWVVLHSCQPNTNRLLSVSNGLGQVNSPY